MDCVTCLLMGMCMLCQPGIGGSKSQTRLDSGTDAPGRPLTEAEVDNALQKFFTNLLNDVEKQRSAPGLTSGFNNNRSFLIDPKFYYSGIGKRSSLTKKLDIRTVQKTSPEVTAIFRDKKETTGSQQNIKQTHFDRETKRYAVLKQNPFNYWPKSNRVERLLRILQNV